MGSAVKPAEPAAKRKTESDHFALIPRRVVRHRMETAECLEDRLFWAIILLSWCGPQTCQYAALKNDRGYLAEVVSTATKKGEQVVSTTTPIPAKVNDLLKLLNLAPAVKGNASRALARLEEKGSIRRTEGRIYPLKEPPAAADPPPQPAGMAAIRRFVIGDKVISTDNFQHLDPDTFTAVEQWLEGCSTGWKNEFNALRYRWRNEIVQGESRFGISIYRKAEEKKKLASSPCPDPDHPYEPEEEDAPDEPWYPPAPPPDPPPVENPPVEEPKSEPAIAAEREEIRQMSTEAGQMSTEIRQMCYRLGFANILSESLCDQIQQKLNGAPLECLEAYARKNRHRMDGPGILPYFAESAARQWELTQRIIESTQPLIDRHLNPEHATDFLIAMANDPTLSADVRDVAREQLRERGIELDE